MTTGIDYVVVRQALYVASDTRLIDLCHSLGLTTAEASAFREQCWALHEFLRKGAPE